MARRNEGRTIVLAGLQPPRSGDLVLGFDVSSSTIGWGLVASEGPILVAHGHYRPPTSKHSLHHRLSASYDFAKDLCERFSPTVAAVEEIALFIKGKSSARTITTLAFFNGAVALAAYRALGGVRLYPVSTIRKTIKKSLGLKGTPRKEEIPSIIREHLEPGFAHVPKRGSDEPAVQTNDEADGIAVAWSCALELAA